MNATDTNLSTADMVEAADRRNEINGGAVTHTDELARSLQPAVRNEGQAAMAALFDEAETRQLRDRWQQAQTSFVDEPRQAVEQADALVATVIKRLAEIFAQERNKLEQSLSKGDQVSTEDLRLALRQYRSFFDRLLSV